MRDLVKIRYQELSSFRWETVNTIIDKKLKEQIKRSDITILNITQADNPKEDCIDCYVDYEFREEKGVDNV